MGKTDAFYLQFRSTLLLTFFSGTYIPGINIILPKYFPTHVSFFVFVLVLSFNCLDAFLKITLYPDDLDFLMVFAMGGAIFWYGLGSLSTLLFIHRRGNMQDLISTWSSDFDPKLWPEIREAALKNQKDKAWMKISRLLKFYLIPYVIMISCVVVKGELPLASILVSGKSLQAPRWIVLIQCLGGVSLMFWYAMLQCFFSTILRLILVELEYMEMSLQKIFSTIRILGNGSIYNFGGKQVKDEDYRELSGIAKERLVTLIGYHCKILKFSQQVQKIFGPIFFFQVLVLSLLVSIMAYAITTGILAADVAAMAMGSLGYFSFLCYLNCSIGGEIDEKSSRVVDGAFYSNWYVYPVPIQKLLVPMIAQSKLKPISVNPLGLLPLNPNTFASLTMLQYKFYTFLSDTVQR